MMSTTESTRRDWNWDRDGALDGAHYLETREVTVKNGPSAGQTKLVFDFHAGLEDELVSVWETSVIRSKLAAELKRRGKSDFEPGELMKITPLEWRESANGKYRDFAVWFEHAAPKRSAAEMLGAGEAADGSAFEEPPPPGDADVPAEDDSVPY